MQLSLISTASVVSALILLIVSCSVREGHAAQMAHSVFNVGNCSTSVRSSTPFALIDKCTVLGPGDVKLYQCTANGVLEKEWATLAECEGGTNPVSSKLTTCSLVPDFGTSISFTCNNVDDSKLVTMKISPGGSCAPSGTAFEAGVGFFEFVLVLNTCLKVPTSSAVEANSLYYRAASSPGDKTIQYTTYTNADCTLGASLVSTGTLDRCVSSSNDEVVLFQTTVPGTTIIGSAANVVHATSAVAIFVAVSMMLVTMIAW